MRPKSQMDARVDLGAGAFSGRTVCCMFTLCSSGRQVEATPTFQQKHLRGTGERPKQLTELLR